MKTFKRAILFALSVPVMGSVANSGALASPIQIQCSEKSSPGGFPDAVFVTPLNPAQVFEPEYKLVLGGYPTVKIANVQMLPTNKGLMYVVTMKSGVGFMAQPPSYYVFTLQSCDGKQTGTLTSAVKRNGQLIVPKNQSIPCSCVMLGAVTGSDKTGASRTKSKLLKQ